jgi:hypothetical protein
MNSDYLFLVRTPDQSPSDPEQTAVEAAKFKRTTVTGRKNGLPERNRQCPWATLEGFTYFAVLSIEQAQLKSVRDPIFQDSDFLEFWHSPEFKSQRGPFQSSLDSLEACEDIASLNRNDLGIDLPPAVFEEIYNAELGLDL